MEKGVKEFLTWAAVGALAFTGVPKIARAADVAVGDSYVIQEETGPISNTTISNNWLAWGEGEDISVLYRTNPDIQYIVNEFGGAYSPNLDGSNLVYQQGNNINLFNLDSMSNATIYSARSGEACSNPKINGDNLVFKVTRNSRDEIWAYNLEEEMVFPITNSSRSKGIPDIYLSYVVWPERVDKVNSLEGLVDGDWDVKGYNLARGLEFDINNDPNYSSGSCVIFGNLVAYSMNTLPGSFTGLQTYYIDTQDIRDTTQGPCGKIYDLALNENILSWTRTPPSAYGGASRNRIEAMTIEEGVSPGFTVNASAGVQSGSDTFKKSDGSAVISYAEGGSPLPSQGTVGILSVNEADEVKEERSLMVSSEIITSLEAKIDYISRNWLKKHKDDLTGDGITNFEDYAKLFRDHSTEE